MKHTETFTSKLLFLVTAFLLVGVFGFPQKAESYSESGKGVVTIDTLEETDTYDQADLDGDGEKDKLKFIHDSNNKSYKLYFNGKRIKTWKASIPSVQIVTVKSVSYLELAYTETKNGVKGEACGLYRIRSGKLKGVLNYQKLLGLKYLEGNAFVYTGRAEDHVRAASVSGNKIYLNFSLGTKSLGQIRLYEVPLKVQDGKFTLLTSTVEVGSIIYADAQFIAAQNFIAAQKIKIYTSAGGSKVSFIMTKNSKFSITGCKIKNKKIYLKIKTAKGKTGWLPLSTSSTSLVKYRGVPIGG